VAVRSAGLSVESPERAEVWEELAPIDARGAKLVEARRRALADARPAADGSWLIRAECGLVSYRLRPSPFHSEGSGERAQVSRAALKGGGKPERNRRLTERV